MDDDKISKAFVERQLDEMLEEAWEEALKLGATYEEAREIFLEAVQRVSNTNRSEAATEAAARRAAKRCGWHLQKSRRRNLTIDDQGKFRIIDPDTNSIVAGEKFNLAAEDVIEFCQEALMKSQKSR